MRQHAIQHIPTQKRPANTKETYPQNIQCIQEYSPVLCHAAICVCIWLFQDFFDIRCSVFGFSNQCKAWQRPMWCANHRRHVPPGGLLWCPPPSLLWPCERERERERERGKGKRKGRGRGRGKGVSEALWCAWLCVWCVCEWLCVSKQETYTHIYTYTHIHTDVPGSENGGVAHGRSRCSWGGGGCILGEGVNRRC